MPKFYFQSFLLKSFVCSAFYKPTFFSCAEGNVWMCLFWLKEQKFALLSGGSLSACSFKVVMGNNWRNKTVSMQDFWKLIKV